MRPGHTKRLAMLLAVLMLVSLSPVHALADELEPAEEEAVLTEGELPGSDIVPDSDIAAEPVPIPEPYPYSYPDPDPDFMDAFKDCPTITPGGSVHIAYDGTKVSGTLLFTAPESREYMFSSESEYELCAYVYAKDGLLLGSAGGYRSGGFSLTVTLEAGETYVVLAYIPNTDEIGEYDVFCRVCPKVTGLKAVLAEGAAPLIVGVDGGCWTSYWDDRGNSFRYYCFYGDCFARLVSVTAVYDDGSEASLSFGSLSWSAEQHRWKPGGENLLFIKYRGLTAEVSIPILAFIDAFAGVPELTAGGAVHVAYDGTKVSGAMRFTAPETWKFTFSAENEAELTIAVYSAAGEYIAADSGRRVSLTLALKEGETYFVLTSRSSGNPGEYDVSCRGVPKLTDLTAGAIDDPLVIGVDDGRWIDPAADDDRETAGTSVRYYEFSQASLDRVVQITGIYDDGSAAALTLSDVTWEADQSAWTAGGQNELLITAAGVTRRVFISVADFSSLYAGCPTLELDVPAPVEYNGSLASGVFTFTPAESGDYCFYSADNRSDPAARLLDENGGALARNDDSADLDNINFLILTNLTAGETYILSTFTSNGRAGTYSVVVSRSMPENGGYDSLNGVDLSGKAINLVFVVDTTGSMTDEIANVRNNLRDFVTAVSNTGATLRISLIDYRDITIGEPTVLHYSVSSNMIWYENNDVEELRTEIGSLDACGGGDRAESVVDALGYTVEEEYLMFNSTAAKFAFLLTDADYKEENTHGLSGMSELIGRLQQSDIAVSVITDTDDYNVYKDLASRTGGVIMDIYGDFSNVMGAYAASIVADAADYVPDATVTPVTGVSLGDDLTVPLGKLKNFTAYITPKNATDKRLRWEVEDESIVAISSLTAGQRLVVEGVSLGTTRITVRSYDGGYVDSFEMTVKEVVNSGGVIEATDPGKIRDYLDEMEASAGGGSGGASAPAPEAWDYKMVNYVAPGEAVSGADQTGILSRIAGTGMSMSYVFDDEYGDMLYEWTFRGADIADPTISVDMTIETGGDLDVPEAVKETLGDYVVVAFAHEGALPGTAQIRLRVDLPDGAYSLFRLDPVTAALEKTGEVRVKDGVAAFEIERCARSVIGSDDTGTEASGLYGDVNGDDAVDTADAALILQGVDLTPDVAAQILLYSVGLLEEWPADGPAE